MSGDSRVLSADLQGQQTLCRRCEKNPRMRGMDFCTSCLDPRKLTFWCPNCRHEMTFLIGEGDSPLELLELLNFPSIQGGALIEIIGGCPNCGNDREVEYVRHRSYLAPVK